MQKRVAIVGVAQTTHGDFLPDNIRDLAYRLARQVLDPLGLQREDVDTVVSSSSDYWMGISCSNSYYFDAAGSYLKNATKAAEDGAFALCYATMRILSGHHRTALVLSITKGSEIPSYWRLTNLYGDPFFQRPVGLNEVAVAALQAQAYRHQYGLTDNQLASVVVKNLGNALHNPHAHRKAKLSLEDVFASNFVAYPLRALDCAGPSDGGCALLLANEEVARDLSDSPTWISGIGWNTDSYWLGDRDLLKGTLVTAARRAYEMAGIKNPSDEIDVAEVCEPTSFQEILWGEQLGLCPEGKGGKFAEEGVTSLKGKIPVNPSGGVLSTHPYVARGLIRVAEAALQVMGKANGHQVPNVRRALAHSVHGLGGQAHTVVILERKD
ncbi:MAG: thiolase family protein [Deltaproteobacteria bacterium]|nr:thiolase family protein [Deltaproteobacteria bacterium]